METSVSKPMDRVDGRLKVTGKALYSAEHPVPGIVHAVMITSSIAKGRIQSVDTQVAESAPGVLSVLTYKNAPKLENGGNGPAGAKSGPTSRKLNLLQDDKILFSNQPIGIVVADTFECAVHAAELVRFRYIVEHSNVVLEKGLSNAYKPEKSGGGGDPTDSLRGDPPAASKTANTRIEHLYVTPTETHNPMEPHATIAVWEGSKLTLYDATQGVFNDRERVASILGLHPDDVRVVSPFLGGGFGSKGPTWSHVVLVAMAAKQVGKPVKLVVAREQMFGSLGFRPRTHQNVALATDQQSKLVSIRHDTVTLTSTFDEFVEASSLQARMLYAAPSATTSHRLVRLDMGTPSFMRAPGESSGNFALESAMDELAYESKIDPLELRLRNYAEQDPEKEKPWSSKSLRECYRIGAETFGWSKRDPKVRANRDGNWLTGWGMATSCYPTKRGEASAKAKLRADGSALVECGTQDLGTGTYTVMTQIAADGIGLPPNRVTFRLGDTDFPETPVSGGSQTAASTGSAVMLAARALREKLVQMAVSDTRSPLTGADAGNVEIDNGTMILKGDPTKRETFATMMARQGKEEIEAEADAKPGEEQKRYSMYAFGAQFAEVKVDADLGQIKVTRLVGAFAAGKILNAKTARSQLMGGMVWGIGMALLENTMIDPLRGRTVNANLSEYLVPVNKDVPNIEVITVPEDDPYVNPIGVKGVGEIGITGSTAAIVNAVYHATGKRVRELPITLDKLL